MKPIAHHYLSLLFGMPVPALADIADYSVVGLEMLSLKLAVDLILVMTVLI